MARKTNWAVISISKVQVPYRQALAAIQKVYEVSRPAGHRLLEYLVRRLEFAAKYVDAAENLLRSGRPRIIASSHRLPPELSRFTSISNPSHIGWDRS